MRFPWSFVVGEGMGREGLKGGAFVGIDIANRRGIFTPVFEDLCFRFRVAEWCLRVR
jgi:hypothetical protein